MFISAHSLTNATLNITTEEDKELFLRIKYVGTRSDCTSNSVGITVLKPQPKMSQEEAFDLIKSVAVECRDANLTWDRITTTANFPNVRSYRNDDYVYAGTLRFMVMETMIRKISGSSSSIELDGKPYGDTFIATVTTASELEGCKKGCFLPSAIAPIQNEFDLEKNNGKFVISFTSNSGTREDYWLAYEGEALQTGGIFYCIKKVSTIRRNVDIDL